MSQSSEKLSKEDKEECYDFICWLKEYRGYSNSQLAKEFGVVKSTIYNWLNHRGVNSFTYSNIMNVKAKILSETPEVYEKVIVNVNMDQDAMVESETTNKGQDAMVESETTNKGQDAMVESETTNKDQDAMVEPETTNKDTQLKPDQFYYANETNKKAASLTIEELVYFIEIFTVIIAYVYLRVVYSGGMQDYVGAVLFVLLYFTMKIVDFTIHQYVATIRCFVRG